MLARLTEFMFVEVLRRYMQELAPGQKGWLAGLKDPYIDRAFKRQVGKPPAAWRKKASALQTLR